ncbi:hypothetical protein HK096_006119 [Nowakowskiella sp. JEL0078]|nr:hypothetical protein HK096_006119 [Nowakowskiella sp. JEL0078]
MNSNSFQISSQTTEKLFEEYTFFLNIQRAYGRTALLLSGGATFGLAHLGVIKTLLNKKLLPRIISGSSVGSIIAALTCCKTEEELVHLFDYNKLNTNLFGTDTIFQKLNNWRKTGAFFNQTALIDGIKENIGVATFQEAFNKTRRILNVTVSSSDSKDMPRLLNYLTAPHVYIWSAVAASCSIPLFFESVEIKCKNEEGEEVKWENTGYRWIDGSVENDLPMARLSELFFVNHFIVSQVNPHVLPFLPSSQLSLLSRITTKCVAVIQSEILHRLNQFQLLDIGRWSLFGSLVGNLESILVQKYCGDITIVPKIGLLEYTKLLGNPAKEIFERLSWEGEKATWEQISRIKNQLAIELCIDELMYRLRVQRVEQTRYIQQETPHFNFRTDDFNKDKRSKSEKIFKTSVKEIDVIEPVKKVTRFGHVETME